MRLAKTEPLFVGYPDDDSKQRQRIDKPGNDFETQIAKGTLGVCITTTKAKGGIEQRQCRGIRQHMSRIHQQRQRTGKHIAHDFYQHKGKSNQKSDQDLTFI